MASTEAVPGGRVCSFGKSYSERRETRDEIKTNFWGGGGGWRKTKNKHLIFSLPLNAYVTFRRTRNLIQDNNIC
jgi:hypothetical protein